MHCQYRLSNGLTRRKSRSVLRDEELICKPPQVVICTGASSGIGLATAKLLLSRGASVYGVDVSNTPSGISESENTFKFQQCDLAGQGVPGSVVEGCHSHFGQIDALLNVAGVMDLMGSVDTLTDEEWDRVISINLTAPVKLMRATVNYWRKGGPVTGKAIANVSSKAGQSGAAAGVAYTASKHGLVLLASSCV